jgi:hypothetical protein
VLHVAAIVCAIDWLSKLGFALALGDPVAAESTLPPAGAGFFGALFGPYQVLMGRAMAGGLHLSLVYHFFDSAARMRMAAVEAPYLAILAWVAWRYGRTKYPVTHFLLAVLCAATLANTTEALLTGKITDFLAIGTAQHQTIVNVADLVLLLVQPIVIFVVLPIACVCAIAELRLQRSGRGHSPPS